MARGVGEKLSQLSKLSDCYIAIAKPDCGVNTANAFAMYDASGANYSADTDGIITALDKNDQMRVGMLLGNALESVCIPNESEWIKKQMLKHSAYGAVMTGSGSAVFGLFETKSDAKKCLDDIEAPFKALCVPESAGIKIVKTE